MNILYALLLAAAVAAPASAMTVSPMAIEMSASGKNARATVTVSNPTNAPIAVDTTVSTLTLSDTGEQMPAAGGAHNFLILPPQAMIQPGASQTFRIMWIGDPALPQSESYLIAFNQLPLQGMTSTGINILMSFAVALNIAPVGIKPELDVVDTRVVETDNGPRAQLTLFNPTQAHALLKQADIALATDAGTLTVGREQIAAAFGNGLVQPGRRRTFTLPVSLPPGTHTATARLTFKPAQR